MASHRLKRMGAHLAELMAALSCIMLTVPSAVRAADAVATAIVKRADGTDAGIVSFREATAGVLIKFELKGLTPGAHGLHIHDVGKCEGDFSSSGSIYNPLGAKHGFLHEEGPMAGDLPNIYASADGAATAEIISPFLSLSAEAEETVIDADGAAIVIFEKADDYESEPEGGAGQRQACGVITAK